MENKHKYKQKIVRFFQTQHRMPSYKELGELLGFKSKSSAYETTEVLIEEGFLDKDKTGRLLPGRTFRSLRVLGVVEAGFPTAAEEELADTLTLDEYLVSNKEATYMLKVSGDSMKDAGIMPGDMVLVDRSANARTGDIVIAEVDGAWTMKYFRKSGRNVFLEAANQKYPDIVPAEELKIAAVVKAVIRKY